AARQRGRAQLLAAIGSNGRHAGEEAGLLGGAAAGAGAAHRAGGPRLGGLAALLGPRPRWLAALGAGLGAVVAGGAVVYAAQGAPPDSPLYPVQQAVQVVAQAV